MERKSPKLTAEKRRKLPDSDFAVPEYEGLPIDTPGRTRAAMARFNQYDFPSKASKRRAYRRILNRAEDFGIHADAFKGKILNPSENAPTSEELVMAWEYIDNEYDHGCRVSSEMWAEGLANGEPFPHPPERGERHPMYYESRLRWIEEDIRPEFSDDEWECIGERASELCREWYCDAEWGVRDLE